MRDSKNISGVKRRLIKDSKLVFLFLLAALFLTSCVNLADLRSEQLESVLSEEETKIQEMSKEIIRCFTEDDKEALEELFCEQTRANPDFQEELDAVFDYFECDVYITSEISTTASGGEAWNSGDRTEWDVFPEIPYLKVLVPSEVDGATTDARYYAIEYHWHIINEDKTLEGLDFLSIETLNIDSISIGERL